MDAFGIRAIHPRPERRGFSRSPGKVRSDQNRTNSMESQFPTMGGRAQQWRKVPQPLIMAL
jgi:hypothetical protein